MNQELRNRRAIDLDELERQLRLSAEPTDRVATSDPLAELARLVGQDDPFKDVFAKAMPPAQAQTAGAAPRQDYQRTGHVQIDLLNRLQEAKQPELRPAHGFDAPDHSQPRQDFGAHLQDAPQPDDIYEQQHQPDPAYAEPLAPRKARGFRKRNLVLALGMIGVAGLGVFAAFGMRSHSLLPKSGDVPVIAAKTSPVKERPENPGGAEVPNQNKQIYDAGSTTASAGSAKVVNSVEQPIDLSTAPRAAVPRVVLPGPGSLPGSGAPATADQAVASPIAAAAATPPLSVAGQAAPAQPAGGSAGGEPKRVRSVPIKVGDSGEAGSQAAPAATPAPSPSIASLIAPNSTATDAQAPSAPASVPLPPAQRPRAAVATPEQPASSAVSAQPKPTPSTPAPKAAPKVAKKAPTPAAAESQADTSGQDAGAPLALSPPKVRPGLRTASTEPNAAAPSSSGSGGWTVQLASRPTQADASSAASQLAQKFSGALGGARPGVVHGEAGGKSVYRVRVGSYDKERAAEVCNQVKAAGGSCFIAKN